jgi:hypothetical protein
MFLQAAKKDEERRFVEILAKELNAFPPGELIDSESPDFLVATSEGVIGIEVTKSTTRMNLANKNLNADLWLMRLADYTNARAPFRLKLRFTSEAARNSTSETETNSRESWRT